MTIYRVSGDYPVSDRVNRSFRGIVFDFRTRRCHWEISLVRYADAKIQFCVQAISSQYLEIRRFVDIWI